MHSDFVVVGSGAGGLTAALSAATLGASVTGLESAPMFGGTSAISGGGGTLGPAVTFGYVAGRTAMS
jgi:succinate dehydrogenase/fumarate reductase flavoprotein subunit